ncbi:hypothetical protein BDN72DRAFT_131193 [Pluteus cervinus]|uniref:Uncharacterized protein n=1 Tax=Pluteus cervinus TaxID=181527 RepID=A0ACD3AMA1_9AGAR|nr:hypothetical protein BDN72DRAFT_131193 [Pluteus cervinus]
MPTPRLPPELEYDIFLLAFHHDSGDAKNLVLVAKRVFDWLIPQRFHIVTLSESGSFPITFNETTYQRYGHHVRHLFIRIWRLGEYLHLFPNVVNLAYWIEYTPTHLPSLLQLPLTRLSTAPCPELFQVFSKLTHLDLTSETELHPSNDEIASILYLPRLTHLCVLYDIPQSGLEMFLDKKRCPKLRVAIVWAFGGGSSVLYEHEDLEVDDDRVVMVECEPLGDWQIGASGGLDMWKFAEGVIDSRNTPSV